MNRPTQVVLALAVFIGTGYITRAWFSECMNTVVKESIKASEKEAAKWKAAPSPFDGVKFDKPIQFPKYEPIKFQPRPTPKQPMR